MSLPVHNAFRKLLLLMNRESSSVWFPWNDVVQTLRAYRLQAVIQLPLEGSHNPASCYRLAKVVFDLHGEWKNRVAVKWGEQPEKRERLSVKLELWTALKSIRSPYPESCDHLPYSGKEQFCIARSWSWALTSDLVASWNCKRITQIKFIVERTNAALNLSLQFIGTPVLTEILEKKALFII